MSKCTECKKETSIKTFDGVEYPLCLNHYLILAKDPMYKFISSQRDNVADKQSFN